MAAVCFCPTFARLLQIQQVLCTHSFLLPPPWGAQVHGVIPGRVWSESNQDSTQWSFQSNTHFQWPLIRTLPQFSCKRQLWLNPGCWQPNSTPSLPEHQQVQQQFTPWLEIGLFWTMVTSSSLSHIEAVPPTALLGDAASSPLAPASWKCPAFSHVILKLQWTKNIFLVSL